MRVGFENISRALLWAALLGGVIASGAQACDTCESSYRPGTYTGSAQRLGDGVAYSWVRLDEKGKPAALGVTLTETALNNLPETAPGPMPDVEYVLELPKQAGRTPFDHIGLNWNPKGHEPNGIYNVPHFDYHFYLLPEKDRSRITAKGPDLARVARALPAEYTPAGYVYAKGTEVPMMGGHWVDPKSPELNGAPFTHTFIHGSYDGKLTFLEPMIAKSFLEARTDVVKEIAVPARVLKSAYYPTRYAIRYDAARREYTVSLDGMVWREAPAKGVKAPAAVASGARKTPTASGGK